jgi:hypothetical protein
MKAIGFTLGLRELPAATMAWHLCTVIIPRRTITGRLVRGQVCGATTAVTGCTKNSFRGVANSVIKRHEHQDGGGVEGWYLEETSADLTPVVRSPHPQPGSVARSD